MLGFNKRDKVPLATKWLLAVSFMVTMALNGLAGGSTVLGGVDTAQISDSYPNLFAPAGVTFSIWSLIYVLLLGFVGFVFWYKAKNGNLTISTLTKTSRLLTVNLLFNSLWILAWQYKVLWLSVLLMLGILLTLIRLNNLLINKNLSKKEYALVKLPFSIYFGWITVATIANITTFLVSINWDGFGLRDGVWMVIVLCIGAIIGLTTTLKNSDPAYLAVFVWAYGGILLKHLSPGGFNGSYPSIIIMLAIWLAVFVSLLTVLLNQKVTSKKMI